MSLLVSAEIPGATGVCPGLPLGSGEGHPHYSVVSAFQSPSSYEEDALDAPRFFDSWREVRSLYNSKSGDKGSAKMASRDVGRPYGSARIA